MSLGAKTAGRGYCTPAEQPAGPRAACLVSHRREEKLAPYRKSRFRRAAGFLQVPLATLPLLSVGDMQSSRRGHVRGGAFSRDEAAPARRRSGLQGAARRARLVGRTATLSLV